LCSHPTPCSSRLLAFLSFLFFFTAPPPPAIYTLSLHDALPISLPAAVTSRSIRASRSAVVPPGHGRSSTPSSCDPNRSPGSQELDRKSTRLNSSHVKISYAVFCLKKKKKNDKHQPLR